MPAVTEESKRKLRVSKRKKELENYIRSLTRERNLHQKDCAAVLGIEPGPYCTALKEMKFKTYQLIALLDYLDADPEVIGSILVKERKK